MPGPKRKEKNLQGLRFGNYVVLSYAGYVKGRHRWACQCDCGTIRDVRDDNLLREFQPVTCCGCRQFTKKYKRRGDNPRTKEEAKLVAVLAAMRNRCDPEKYSRTSLYYSAKGITVCDEWLGKEGIDNFLNWAKRSGWKPGLTIDRIDNNSGYSPKNCRWATKFDQARNQSSNVYFTIEGVSLCLTEWVRLSRVGIHTINKRRKLGLRSEEIFEIGGRFGPVPASIKV